MLKFLRGYLSRFLPHIIISTTILLTLGLFSWGVAHDAVYHSIRVVRVVDGDTLMLANGQRVRLLGIDTPEYHESDKLDRDSKRLNISKKDIQKSGYQAYRFTQRLVEGKKIKLEFDQEKIDKFNRLLAYVYLEDGTFLNADIVQSGYATVCMIPPNKRYYKKLLELERDAKQNKRGFWSIEQ